MAEKSLPPRIVTVLGTRPEIIKCSPLLPLFDAAGEHLLVHTGQHYDDNMDASFFRELGLRAPDVMLRVGSGAHGSQLARMLLGIEPLLRSYRPDCVFVQGDTNSTLAGALAAAKLGISAVHLEAGCRSFNRAMPEEINRVLVDHLAELCLAPDAIAERNLRDEGIAGERVVTVGSTGVDACLRASAIVTPDERQFATFEPRSYLVATIHRAENTTPERLGELLLALNDLAASWPVLFPVHPRTAQMLAGMHKPERITYLEPLGYARMMALVRGCRALLTDSGGLQEEAAILGAPTFILRDETEWMAFVDAGRHRLAGTERHAIACLVRATLTGGPEEEAMRQPMGFDRAGAGRRVMDALQGWLETRLKGQATWEPPMARWHAVDDGGSLVAAASRPRTIGGRP